jgi:hypothetical protein
MTKRTQIILSWILAISMVWLPLSVSAEVSPPPLQVKDHCHEMSSAATKTSIDSQSAKVKVVVQEKAYCEHCEDNCKACSGLTSCGHSANHVSPVIIFTQAFSQSLQIVQISIEQTLPYHNWITIPAFRPPVV